MRNSQGRTLVLFAASICAAFGQMPNPSLEECLQQAGVPWQLHDDQPWEAGVTFTVSQFGDASRISFDDSGMKHGGYLLTGVLHELTFKKECSGSVLRLRIHWRPQGPLAQSMSAKENILTVSSFDLYSRPEPTVMLLFQHEVEALATVPSLREFVKKRWPWLAKTQ